MKTKEDLNIANHLIKGEKYCRPDIFGKVINPSTAKIIGSYPTNFNSSELLKILEDFSGLAQKFWHWQVEEQEKEALFRAVVNKFEKNIGRLANVITQESGKLWKWSMAEVREAIDTLWHYHGELSRYYTNDGFTRCQFSDKNAFSVRIPYGKILKISPWNFPLAVPMWAICGALAGGNSIVLKPAEQTPFTLYYAVGLIYEAIKETLPSKSQSLAGLIQVIQGNGETSGKYLIENFDYDKASFTGSGEIGKIIASVAGSRLKPCHLELGGHAAMVVLDDFDVDLAVAEAITANLGDSGQRCVSTRVVFVQDSIYKEFVAKYLERAKRRRIGRPMDLKTEMGPLVSQEQTDRVQKMVESTSLQLGRSPLLGGYQLNVDNLYLARKERINVDEKAILGGGYYYPPTIFTEVPYGMTAMDKEIFGPVIVINPLSGHNRKEAFDNALELVNKSCYGLSNALLTNDRRLSSRAPGRFNTGIFYIGRGTTGAELNKYFGGVKTSGWGREGKGIDDWTQIQQVYDDFHGKPRMAQSGEEENTFKIFSEADF